MAAMASSGRQHNLARDVLRRFGHEGVPGFSGRVTGSDLGPQRALVNQAGDVPQFGAAGVRAGETPLAPSARQVDVK